jgi:hypothetical protein
VIRLPLPSGAGARTLEVWAKSGTTEIRHYK